MQNYDLKRKQKVDVIKTDYHPQSARNRNDKFNIFSNKNNTPNVIFINNFICRIENYF